MTRPAVSHLALLCCTVLLPLLASAGDLNPPGPPAPTMKRLDQLDPSISIPKLPYTITTPGHYTLAGDLSAPPGINGITIASSDVVLDGRGFSLRGSPGPGTGITVEGVLTNVTIQHVNVVGWGLDGVHALQSPVRCWDMTCAANGRHGFFLEASGRLEDCTAEKNAVDGVRVRDSGTTFIDCYCIHLRCVGNGGNGFSGGGLSGLDCDNSLFSGNAGGGLVCLGARPGKIRPLRITLSRAMDNGASGFDFDTNTPTDEMAPHLDRCVASGNEGSGLRLGSTITGIEMFRCLDSSFTGNALDGVTVAGGRLDRPPSFEFTRCTMSNNHRDGWQLLSARQYDKASPKLAEAVCRGNGRDGVRVDVTHPSVSTRLVLDGGDCDDNDACGVRVVSADLDGDGLLDVAIAELRATGNGGDGIQGDMSACRKVRGSWDIKKSEGARNAGCGAKVHAIHRGQNLQLRLVESSFDSNSSHGLDCDSSSTQMSSTSTCRNGGAGMLLESNTATLDSNIADENTSTGLRLIAHEAAHVVQQRAGRNRYDGIIVGSEECDDAYLADCSADGNEGNGIRVESARIIMDRDTGRSKGFNGIVAAPPSSLGGGAAAASYARLTACVASCGTVGAPGVPGAGILSSARTVDISGCTVTDCDGDGLVLTEAQAGSVRDNTFSSNTARGITINTSHVEYSSNRCVGNGTDGMHVVSGTGNVIRDNFFSNNTAGGLHMSSNDNPIYQNNGTQGTNPMYEDPGISNDTAPGSTAASSGLHNIGF